MSGCRDRLIGHCGTEFRSEAGIAFLGRLLEPCVALRGASLDIRVRILTRREEQ